LVAFTFTRVVVSTANRMVYPFLPVIARELAVGPETAALAVALRSSLGLLGPLLGSIADTRGRRPAMVLGLALFAGGMALIAGWPVYLSLLIGLVVSGAGNIIVDAATYAYLGDKVPYAQRGTAIGIIELGWSGAFVIGIPIAGLLFSRLGWAAPFALLAVLGLGSAVLLRRIVDADPPSSDDRPSFARGMRLILDQPAAIAALCVSFFIVTANQSINIMYGVWMEGTFQLQVEQLGLASTVIGFAGLAGVGLVILLVDRLGKRRAVALGIGLNALVCLTLPLAGASLTLALLSLFLFYLSFEFSLVSAIPIFNELVPAARATLLAANVAAFALGDAVGAYFGPLLYQSGLLANSVAAIALNLVALAVLLRFVRLPQTTS
jgi:predicted MFS family arabinose efflux permease